MTIPDEWNKLGTPAPDTRIWWCAEREAFVPGAGHPHWTMPAYCYWTGTVDHNDRCGWVAVVPVDVDALTVTAEEETRGAKIVSTEKEL